VAEAVAVAVAEVVGSSWVSSDSSEVS